MVEIVFELKIKPHYKNRMSLIENLFEANSRKWL